MLQQAAATLPWFHNCVLLEKLVEPNERMGYAEQAIEYEWSRHV